MAPSKDRIDAVIRTFNRFYRSWRSTPGMIYTVVPSESVIGKSVTELRSLKYWVGVQGDGEILSLEELVIAMGTALGEIGKNWAIESAHAQIVELEREIAVRLEVDDNEIRYALRIIRFSQPRQ